MRIPFRFFRSDKINNQISRVQSRAEQSKEEIQIYYTKWSCQFLYANVADVLSTFRDKSQNTERESMSRNAEALYFY